MPQTTQENLNKTERILLDAGFLPETVEYNMDGCAWEYLKKLEWTEKPFGVIWPPGGAVLTEDEWEVATYLVQEWDYAIGWVEEEKRV
jgi:hypothetical protein